MTAPTRSATRPKPRRKAWVEQQSVFVYRYGLVIVGLIIRYWIRCYRAIGAEKVPSSGGVFLIANHTSGMDPFVLGYPIAHRLLWGPGKVELFKNPVFGFLMRKIGMFPLRQGTADAGAVRTMVALYRSGRTVIVYPEGARSETGELLPFNPDFARLVIKLKAPIAPAAIAGGKELLPIGARMPKRRSPIVVIFGDPFDLSQFYGQTLTPELGEQAASVMQSRVADLLVQANEERRRLLASC